MMFINCSMDKMLFRKIKEDLYELNFSNKEKENVNIKINIPNNCVVMNTDDRTLYIWSTENYEKQVKREKKEKIDKLDCLMFIANKNVFYLKMLCNNVNESICISEKHQLNFQRN